MGAQETQLRLTVGGAVNPRTSVYIVRPSDDELLALLERGEYCNVLCSRQMGKTSLLKRTRARLVERGYATAEIEVAGLLGSPKDADEWYQGLLDEIARQLRLPVNVPDWWRTTTAVTANQKLIRFFREEVIAQVPGDKPVIIFLDEIDSTLKLPYTDDFFVAIRAMYNDRASDPANERIAFCLVGVATPNELIKERRTTPYNIGRTIELQDFDPDRDDLSPIYRSLCEDEARGEATAREVIRETGGHPYLTLHVCDALAARSCPSPEQVRPIVEQTFGSLDSLKSDVHFDQMLRFINERVDDKLSTLELYRRIIKSDGGKPVPDQTTPAHINLKLIGLVKRDGHGNLAPRNSVYQRLFTDAWARSAMPLRLTVGGAVNPRTGVYIVRPCDDELLRLLRRGEYCNLLNSRQMGKTSLAARTHARLIEQGHATAYMDLSLLPIDADEWYQGLLDEIARELRLPVNVPDWWRTTTAVTANQKLIRFFHEEVIARIPGDKPVIIFLDEIDSTLKLPYTDDFFVAIRVMYNDRASDPANERIAFCLVGVTTPNDLIKERRTMPYKVGRTIELPDFDPDRDNLGSIYRSLCDDELKGEATAREVIRQTGGHPYLTLRVCELLATNPCTPPEDVAVIIQNSFKSLDSLRSDTHFYSIQRFLSEYVDDKGSTMELYRRVIGGKSVPDRPTQAHINLKLSGLVTRDSEGNLKPRNLIYQRLFTDAWAKTVVPPVRWRVLVELRRLIVELRQLLVQWSRFIEESPDAARRLIIALLLVISMFTISIILMGYLVFVRKN